MEEVEEVEVEAEGLTDVILVEGEGILRALDVFRSIFKEEGLKERPYA